MQKCLRCGGQQEIGFGIDVGHSYVQPSRWVKGPPESSWWQGVKTSGVECRRIDYWRCSRCGLLEAYALESVEAPGLFKS
jgi:predicted nucleic-acid-binding Zn-ribbon protein